mmetsp:Transcript_13700/g.16304  ORF Transcript_13700/g.16304 Transcript_13700/m.16304 type:complete len:683 (-) Transcript_13700:189-2237(-)
MIDELVSKLKSGEIKKDQILSHVISNHQDNEEQTNKISDTEDPDKDVDEELSSEDEESFNDNHRDSFDDLDDDNISRVEEHTNSDSDLDTSPPNLATDDQEFFENPPNENVQNSSDSDQVQHREAWASNEEYPAYQMNPTGGSFTGDQSISGSTFNTSLDDPNNFSDNHERLYRNSKIIAEKRDNLVSKYNEEKEKKFKTECTFKPRLPHHQGKGDTMGRGGFSAPTTGSKNKVSSRNRKHHPPIPSVTVVSQDEREDNESPLSRFASFNDEDLRFRRDSWLEFKGNGAISNDMSECTFSPRTNDIKPKRMPSASNYTKQDIVTRLTPARNKTRGGHASNRSSPHGESSESEDLTTLQDKLMSQYQACQSNNTANTSTPCPATPSRRVSNRLQSPRDSCPATQSFHDMMKRQAQHLMKATENRERSKQAQTPSFKPHINSKSIQMVSESGKGNFNKRLEMQLMSRRSTEKDPHREDKINPYVGMKDNFSNDCDSQSNIDQLIDGIYYEESSGFDELSINKSIFIDDLVRDRSLNKSYSNESTFHPCITAKATALPRRSFEDMSLGDARRREVAARKVMAQEAKKEEMSLTLKPRLTRLAMNSPSTLRLQDPDTYTARIQDANLVRKEKLDRIKREELEKESKECTFQPVTTSCPSYVSRMANAHSAQKSKLSKHPRNKPEWR